MLELGRYSLWAALFFACAAAGFLFMGTRWDRKDLQRNGYYAVYGFFLTTVIASAVLLQAFLKKDFSFSYVAENSDASLSTFYRIAGFWAGQQGSFLFWLLLLAIAVIVIAVLDLNRLERLTSGAVAVLSIVSAVFAALMVFDTGSNPFLRAEAGAVPFGLNPLLLHPAMVFHPPALFIGYVGLAVPFAFAISTLLLARGDKLWVQRSQKWAVFGWLFLSLGIGLGAWWAYVVLSFGGFWAWDPVENTSLVPWLTATALLHAFTLYKARGLFKHWSLGLAAATFWFTILATWTTRTGLIQSVHAFEKRQLLVWILSTFLVVTAGASIGLIAWRWRKFESHDEVESWLSRDFLYYVTNLLLTLFAVAVAFGTVAVPLLLPDRAAGPGRSLWSGLARAFTGSRTRTAAYVVHMGMVLVVAGLLGSTVYKVEESAIIQVKPGQTASLDGYTLTYNGMTDSTGAQSSTRSVAAFDVSRDGVSLGVVEPHTDVYPMSGAAVRAVIMGRPFEDLFVVADEPFDGTSKTIALRMVVFPLIRWVWIGSLLLVAGAVVSLWPKGRRQEQEARVVESVKADATA